MKHDDGAFMEDLSAHLGKGGANDTDSVFERACKPFIFLNASLLVADFLCRASRVCYNNLIALSTEVNQPI